MTTDNLGAKPRILQRIHCPQSRVRVKVERQFQRDRLLDGCDSEDEELRSYVKEYPYQELIILLIN